MHDAAILHVDEMAVVRLDRSSDVKFGRTVRAEEEPVAPAGKHLASEIWTLNKTAFHAHNDAGPV